VATLVDPVGDFLDEDNAATNGPAYEDIVRLDVESRQGRIQLDTQVNATPPKVDPVREEISYVWLMETNGDGEPDWSVIVQNTTSTSEFNTPGWIAELFDYQATTTRGGAAFPGTVVVDGGRITVSVMSDAVGSPARVRVAAGTEHSLWADPVNDPTNVTTVHDDAPAGQWPNVPRGSRS